jgi:hypothetical protein
MNGKPALQLLQHTTFDWTQNLQSIWRDDPYHLPDLHERVVQEYLRKLDQLLNQQPAGASLLGWPLTGAGGTGKTHLLGNFRRLAGEAGVAFIMVDMTDVRDFWDMVLAGYTTSLEQKYLEGEPQRYFVIKGLVDHFANDQDQQQKLRSGLNACHRADSGAIRRHLNEVLSVLNQRYRIETARHADIVRALIVADCADYELAGIGQTWLQGLDIEEDEQRILGIRRASQSASEIVAALSWLISLGAPAIVAFDQIDPILRQLEFNAQMAGEEPDTSQELEAQRIMSSLADGFAAMYDMTRRSLCVLSCLESSYDAMKDRVLKTSLDRYEAPTRLEVINSPKMSAAMIDIRVAEACHKLSVLPPNSGWPVAQADIQSLVGLTPREILRACGEHRSRCLRAGVFDFLQLSSTSDSGKADDSDPQKPGADRFSDLDERFERYQQDVDLGHLLDEQAEDGRLTAGVRALCSALLRENSPPATITPILDLDFTGGSKTKPLHARVRLVFHEEDEREEHFSIRVIQRRNAIAFQNRLKLAMTAAGIDRVLDFRHLAVVRSEPVPSGRVTTALCAEFQQAGGVFVELSDADLRVIDALRRMLDDNDAELDAWLANRQWASGLAFCQRMFGRMLDRLHSAPPIADSAGNGSIGTKPKSETDNSVTGLQPADPPEEASSQETASEQAPSSAQLALGIDSGGSAVTIPIEALEKHTVVLAGAGSGKTVLLKRVVEMASLSGVPSIVIDGANDLAALADAWPDTPEGWIAGDTELAERYHRDVQKVIWTPGRQGGNPLRLEVIPDISGSIDDEDEFSSAIAMISGGLADLLSLGNSRADQNKRGILSQSLRHYTKTGGSGLSGYVDLLTALPDNARLGIAKEAALASELADSLRVLAARDPMIGNEAEALDPAVLLGDDRDDGKTRISVINLGALSTLENQQRFINQFATTLFAWIKRHPVLPPGRGLRGLLVIDEARDFIPSKKTTACKDSLIRLTAQARKYHLGVVFATQNPREIENTIVGNCSTHFYGKTSSPAAIETVRDLIRERGGDAPDIARLERGNFYVFNADKIRSAQKVRSPLCLSHHRTLSEDDVVELALRGRL